MSDRALRNGEAYVVSAVRTPVGVGKPGRGALSGLPPLDLAAPVLQEAARRAGVAPGDIEDVIMGCVSPIGEQGANIARLALLKGGFPVSVPGVTLSRMCGSSQQALHFAAQAVASGDMELVIAAGVEVMSRVPIGSDWPANGFPDDFPYPLIHQGLSAELIAEKWGLSRAQLDDFAYESHLRAGAAIRADRFQSQILPVTAGEGAFSTDEGVRMEPDRERMGQLKPAFKPDGVITAGNSSQISDGAAALVVASARAVRERGLRPLARVAARAVVGSDPELMLEGPIPATAKALARAGLTLEQMDLIEINEAFASVVLAWQKATGADMSRVNVNGGAIALGHPLGATGAILATKLLYELERRGGRYGLQTMCIGHGQATATVFERMPQGG